MAGNARFRIGEDRLTLKVMRLVASKGVNVELTAAAVEKMDAAHQVVRDVLKSDRPVYGVNTGFGKFSEVRISAKDLNQLQQNLVRSHACGVGPELSEAVVRMVMVSKANSLARGYSGCRPALAKLLVEMNNRGVNPCVPAHGSVGASGDLAPLSHVALVMIGEGEAIYEGERLSGDRALEKAGLEAVELGPKEGLSIINGTQVSASLAVKAWLDLERLIDAANVACAWTLEGVAGRVDAFDPRVHQIRGHKGAEECAARVVGAVMGSEILESDDAQRRVQDPYAIRCAPQVHGAAKDVLENVREMLETELNGVTDNPLVFADSGDIISGGNFHAEPMAMVADQLAVAGAEIASISERRTFLLTDPQFSGLPAFLVKEGGLNSGFMLHHVSQAALVSQNKTLSHPASVDSITTSAGKEDHVSMATWAGYKACQIMDNVTTVLAIEMLAAAQAVDLRAPAKPGDVIAEVQHSLREIVGKLDRDRYSKPDIDAAREWLLAREW